MATIQTRMSDLVLAWRFPIKEKQIEKEKINKSKNNEDFPTCRYFLKKYSFMMLFPLQW